MVRSMPPDYTRPLWACHFGEPSGPQQNTVDPYLLWLLIGDPEMAKCASEL